MKFSRAKLQRHLKRIHTDSEISEVILRPDLSASAITPDRSLLVDVPPGTDEDEGLPEEVGVIDLNMFIQALKLGDNPEVEVQVVDQRILVDEGETGDTKFLTADPETVGTKIAEEEREAILGEVEEHPGVPLGQELISAIKGRQDLLGALEVKLNCSEEGTQFIIGTEKGHYGTYNKGDLVTQDGEEYSLILQANTLVRVFGLVPDPDEAEIVLTGPDSVVGIQFEDHTYVLNPMSEED